MGLADGAKVEAEAERVAENSFTCKPEERRMTSARKLSSYNTATSRRTRGRRSCFPFMVSRLFNPFAQPLVTRLPCPSFLFKASFRMGLPVVTASFEGTLSTRTRHETRTRTLSRRIKRRKASFARFLLHNLPPLSLPFSIFLYLLSYPFFFSLSRSTSTLIN